METKKGDWKKLDRGSVALDCGMANGGAMNSGRAMLVRRGGADAGSGEHKGGVAGSASWQSALV